MMKATVLSIALVLTTTPWLTAEDPPANRRDTAPSLDDLLLDDLDNQLLDDLPPATDREDPSAAAQDDQSGLQTELDRMLLEQLGEGEDLGEESSDPLASIARQMRTVEQLIAQRNTSENTQRIQQRIIEDMEALIDELKKKCSGGQCNNNGPKQPGKPSDGNKAGSGENQGSNRPAEDSTDRVGAATKDGAELERLERMLKSVWGHLPPKVREQMQNGNLEQFLPKYQELIEDYYKRLATDAE